MAPPPVGKKHERAVGAGLSLDKFAGLGVSKFDKRRKIERIKKEQIIRHSKYSKLKKKLEAQGLLSRIQLKDSVAELDALDGNGSAAAAVPTNTGRVGSHTEAAGGPGSNTQSHAETKGSAKLHVAAAAEDSLPQLGRIPPSARGQLGHNRSTSHDGDLHGPGRKRPRLGDNEAEASKHAGQGRHPSDEGQHRGGRSEDAGGKEGGDRSGGSPSEGGQDGRRGGGKETRLAGRGSAAGGRGSGPRFSRLERLAQQVEHEKAEKHLAKEAAAKEREERMKRVAAVEKTRKEQKHIHFKRTAKGQPLMRYRMEKLLSQLEHSAQ